ncbi:MAG: hypothetical protein U9N62_04135 [Thermotogota bacterium]|nr:hypothetical protein [Thermotogota bacterium]
MPKTFHLEFDKPTSLFDSNANSSPFSDEEAMKINDHGSQELIILILPLNKKAFEELIVKGLVEYGW